MPGDVVDAAVKQCESTLKTSIKITPELLQSLLEKFAEFRVTKTMIEARIQRRFDAITPALVAQLGKIYNSLKDGMGSVSDWFDVLEGMDEPGCQETLPIGKFAAYFDPGFSETGASFNDLDRFVQCLAKHHKTSAEEVKQNAIKDSGKFLNAFKKDLVKQGKTEKTSPSESSSNISDTGPKLNDTNNERPAEKPINYSSPIEKNPILCPIRKSGVLPAECEACDESKNPDNICSAWTEHQFDQSQK